MLRVACAFGANSPPINSQQDIVCDGLPRCTGQRLEVFGDYLLPTNFIGYLETFRELPDATIGGRERPMPRADRIPWRRTTSAGGGKRAIELAARVRAAAVLVRGNCSPRGQRAHPGHAIGVAPGNAGEFRCRARRRVHGRCVAGLAARDRKPAYRLFELRLVRDWHGTSAPLLAIGGIALVTAYLPPDYRGQTHSRFDVKLDSARSHHAMAYALPRDLRADQPIYLAVYWPANFPPVGVRITDEHAYRIGDLAHVRASTFFVSVLVSMVLVILCFWVVLRDRMFVYFIVYVSAAKAEGRNRVVVWRREAFEAAVAGTA